MNAHAKKKYESKRLAGAVSVSQIQGSGETAFQVVDNRPEAIVQRKLAEIMDKSPQAEQAAQYLAMANSHPTQATKEATGIDSNPVIYKAKMISGQAPVQRRFIDELEDRTNEHILAELNLITDFEWVELSDLDNLRKVEKNYSGIDELKSALCDLKIYKDAIHDVLALMNDGPGNQTGSSDEAKRSFSETTILQDLLSEQPYGTEISQQSINAIARDALYRKKHMDEDSDTEVDVHARAAEGGMTKRNELTMEGFELAKLTEIVWHDFALKKTGGGSCDHISAATFLNLVSKGKRPCLVRYKPREETDNYTIKPPEGSEWHRSVVVNEDETTAADIDSWWPGGVGSIQIFEDEKMLKAMPDLEIFYQWKPDDSEFVKALQKELEIRYGKIDAEKWFGKGDEESVKALWEITKSEF